MYDLIIIGAGPGGYEAAIRARQNNLSVLLFEKDQVGGTCLNRGCIPTKALLHAGNLLHSIKKSAAWGIHATIQQVSIEEMYRKKDEIVSFLRDGVEQLLKQYGVDIIKAAAAYAGDGKVIAGNQTYEAKDVLLASGSMPALPPIPGLDLEGVITSDQFLSTPFTKNSLCILGGGVIGVELATFCLALGIKTTIIEAMPRILPQMDREFSQSVAMNLKKDGALILSGKKLLSVEPSNNQLSLTIEGADEPLLTDSLLVAVGRTAAVNTLFTHETHLPQMIKGRIEVDEHQQTSTPHLYAIGDVTGGIQLAHAAAAQGRSVADWIAGKAGDCDLQVIPACLYTTPEIACVGITEAEAKEKSIEIISSKYLMAGNGRTLVSESGRGFIKVIADKQSRVVLGAQLMCDAATDIIDQMTLAIVNKMTIEQLLIAIRPHPTYVEGLSEALEGIDGRAIHMPPQRKRSSL